MERKLYGFFWNVKLDVVGQLELGPLFPFLRFSCRAFPPALAISLRRCAVSFFALAEPPFSPPR